MGKAVTTDIAPLPLTVFANYFINSHERLLRLKDSFSSFERINPERWVINIRGMLRDQAEEFLKANIAPEKLNIFHLNSRWGWFHDSRKMLASIESDFILFWVEDHINLAPTSSYRGILAEMRANQVDLLRYSWWCLGRMPKRYEGIPKVQGDYIQAFDVTRQAHELVQKNSPGSYLIDIPCIFKAAFFKRIVNTRLDPWLPRFSIQTPFDFEKNSRDLHWLPFKKAIPNFELFASIDDDLGVEGYSLQSRGLYPIRESRQEHLQPSDLTARLKNKLPNRLRGFLFLFKRVLYYF